MKVAILAGGFGTRLAEETTIKPKPMIEIGGKPILWHIMKCYAAYGYNEFVIALGYKGDIIIDYFLNYRYRSRNITIHLKNEEVIFHNGDTEDWIIHLIDTGLYTETGGRVKRVVDFIGDETFMLTYGDGLADINIHDLVNFHNKLGKLVTVTSVHPPARFGGMILNGASVENFKEKPNIGEGWINGGFFVLEPSVAEYIEGDRIIFEQEPLEKITSEGQMVAFRHNGFWQCMDTKRDVNLLESLWQSSQAPWKVWK